MYNPHICRLPLSSVSVYTWRAGFNLVFQLRASVCLVSANGSSFSFISYAVSYLTSLGSNVINGSLELISFAIIISLLMRPVNDCYNPPTLFLQVKLYQLPATAPSEPICCLPLKFSRPVNQVLGNSVSRQVYHLRTSP